MDEICNKQRSRIWGVQKRRMLNLVENFYIRKIGHHHMIGNLKIDMSTWNSFACELNSIGPSKTAEEWKKSFKCMKARVRKMMQHENGENRLSDLDQRMYEMFPNVSTRTQNRPMNDNQSMNDNEDGCGWIDDSVHHEYFNERQHNEDMLDCVADEDCNEQQTNEAMVLSVADDDFNDQQLNQNVRDSLSVDKDLDYNERDDDMYDGNECKNETEVDVAHTLTFHTTEAIESNEPSVNLHITRLNSFDEIESNDIEVNSETIPNVDNFRSVKTRAGISRGATVTQMGGSRGGSLRDTNSRGGHMCGRNIRGGNVRGTNVRRGHLRNIDITESAEIPDIQRERLVQLVQNNFQKTVGRYVGTNGVQFKRKLWETFAEELNSLGPPRTAVQWKNAHDYIKSSAKYKLAYNHNIRSGSGFKVLSRLEEKIVSMNGLDNLDGNQLLGEGGFQYEKTIPVTARIISSKTITKTTECLRDISCNSTVTSAEHIASTSQFASGMTICNLCATSNPKIRCQQCNMILCDKCDLLYHNHPLRKEHTREITSIIDRSNRQNENVTETSGEYSTICDLTSNQAENDEAEPNQSARSFHNAEVGGLVGQPNTMFEPINVTAHRSPNILVSDAHQRNSLRKEPQTQPSNVSHAREKHANARQIRTLRRDVENESPNVSHDHDRHTNRVTSYDMVQQSINNQANFIERNDRNHSELMHTFTAALSSFTSVLRDYLLRN